MYVCMYVCMYYDTVPACDRQMDRCIEMLYSYYASQLLQNLRLYDLWSPCLWKNSLVYRRR